MRKVITKIIFFMFFLYKSILIGQIPTELNHLSNIVAKRLAVRGEIDLNYFDQNHISSFDLNKLFLVVYVVDNSSKSNQRAFILNDLISEISQKSYL